MINEVFKINGVDFSGIVHKKGYTIGRIPVLAKSITDLNGRTREFIMRYKSTLNVPCNPIPDTQIETLSDQLQMRPLTVTFYDKIQNKEVTKQMLCVSFEFNPVISGWVDVGTLKFEER